MGQLTRTVHPLGDAAAVAGWDALADVDPTATPFQRPRFLRAVTSSLGLPAVDVWRFVDDDELVGVVAVAQDDGVLRFAGGTDVTDYLGPVAQPERRREVATAIVASAATLLEDGAVAEVVLEGLPADAPAGLEAWPDLLRRAVEDADVVVATDEVHDVCPRVDLAGGHDAYLERLDSRTRKEQLRKARKLARDLGGIELVSVPAAEHPTALERFLAMAATDTTDKGGFFRDERMRTWFADLVAAYADGDVLRIHELHVAGAPAASMVSLVEGGEWGLYNSAFEASLAPFGAGMVLVGQLLAAAADDGCDVFDFLRGDEAYKYQFGSVDRSLVRLVLQA